MCVHIEIVVRKRGFKPLIVCKVCREILGTLEDYYGLIYTI